MSASRHTHAEGAHTYVLQEGESIPSVLFKLGFKKNFDAMAEKTSKLNRETLRKYGNQIPAGTIILIPEAPPKRISHPPKRRPAKQKKKTKTPKHEKTGPLVEIRIEVGCTESIHELSNDIVLSILDHSTFIRNTHKRVKLNVVLNCQRERTLASDEEESSNALAPSLDTPGGQKKLERTVREKLTRHFEEKKSENTIVVDEEPVAIQPFELTFNKVHKAGRKPQSISEIDYSQFRRSYFFPSLGYSFHQFKQGSTLSLKQSAINVRMSYRNLVLPPHIHLDANADFTALPIGASSSDESFRFLDINARGGYAFPFIDEPWRFTFFLGAYYTTMITPGQFGYTSTIYPQLYPELRRLFSTGDSVSLALKFVSTGGSFFSLGSNERAISVGLRWIRPTSWEFPLIFELEYSSFQFLTKPAGTRIDSTTYGIRTGIAF